MHLSGVLLLVKYMYLRSVSSAGPALFIPDISIHALIIQNN